MSVFWYDGKLIDSQTLELAIDDPGLLYGATVFTTIRVYEDSLNHPLTNWNAHCQRLQSNLQAFGWSTPKPERLRQGAELIIPHYPILRITIFPDGREWITGRNLPQNLTGYQKNGISVTIAPREYNRSLPTHKTGNYLGAWLARNNALQMDAQEAILVDSDGNWLETATGNLWGWRDNCWWTPPITAGILPGIMRSQILQWLKMQGLLVREEPWKEDLVSTFEAIAYSNSVVEIIPIHTVISENGSLKYNPHHPSFQILRGIFHRDG